ncbi:MAG: triose-phosphate isomerase [Polyangiaceae bacterium]|nr:triose-phosphate isomerase [Polyangiaceae bacterium]
MKRRAVIAGNWKMYKGGALGVELAQKLVVACGDLATVDVVVAPPFTALAAVAHELQGSRIDLGAQNLHPAAEGAFTGEVSAPMLLESGVRWVIIGHSERRQLFGETDDSVRDKVRAALEHGLRPIVCLGETLAEREAGRTLEVVHRQFDAFAATLASKPGFGVVAYEPVWAIGTGKVASVEQAEEVHSALRARLANHGPEVAERTRILYGGSVKPDNAAALLDQPNIDGALVGGASLDAESFCRIVAAAPSAA